MRIITIMMGTLFSITGIYLIANGGLTFMSVAFIVGLMFAVAGVIECLSYSGYRGEDETKSWILIDGTCTFMLGVLILMNKLSAEAAVPGAGPVDSVHRHPEFRQSLGKDRCAGGRVL